MTFNLSDFTLGRLMVIMPFSLAENLYVASRQYYARPIIPANEPFRRSCSRYSCDRPRVRLCGSDSNGSRGEDANRQNDGGADYTARGRDR